MSEPETGPATQRAAEEEARWLTDRRGAAGAWLCDRLIISNNQVASLQQNHSMSGPYAGEILELYDDAVLVRWIWEQVDPEGYAAWLNEVQP